MKQESQATDIQPDGAGTAEQPTKTASKAELAVTHILTRIRCEPRLAWHFTEREAMDLLIAAEAECQGVDFEVLKKDMYKGLRVEGPVDYDEIREEIRHEGFDMIWDALISAKNRMYLEKNAGDRDAILKLEGLIEGLEAINK